MRYVRFIKFILLIIISYFFVSNDLLAQIAGNDLFEPIVTRWVDDTHFLFQTTDINNSPVLQKVDIKTGEAIVVIAEKDEKGKLAETLPAGYLLTSSDIISSDWKSVIFVRENDLFYFSTGAKEATRLTNNPIPEMNPQFSPDGRKIAFTRNKDLYVYDLVDKKEIRISSDATDKIYNGWSSWVYMEEILGRPSAYAAFWWSPDGNKIAYLRTDETLVPVFTLNRLDEADGVHGKIEVIPYPKAGDPNPKVKMGIADIATAKTVWVKTDYDVDQYIAWPFWTHDSKSLAIQVLNRDQNDMKYILADAATGEFKQIYNEVRKTWVEFSENIYVMKNGTGFILKSYASNWENLYYYSWDGTLIARLTNVDWRVKEIERVDEVSGIIYFTGTGPESTDNHFFKVDIDGKNFVQITTKPGKHNVIISPRGNYFIDTWNSVISKGSIDAYDANGKLIRVIYKFEQPVFDPEKNSRTEFVKILTSDGLFNMPALIKYPINFNETKKYPVVFTLYGGPNSESVTNEWNGYSPDWYSLNGIITISVDHRGSGQFGMKGMEYMYRNLGKWEILDYVDAVKWLRNKPYIDATRMGITGSSYGGYITCLALTKGSDFWTHGIAGSSVTDWRLYDNVYTERYMDKPVENTIGYNESSVLKYIQNYNGKLFITHGDIDDNVHLQNSIQFISKLEDAGKSFEFMLYPGGRHGWGGPKRNHLTDESNNFWLKYFFQKE
jgi:dipeptidyl-peptidase 4